MVLRVLKWLIARLLLLAACMLLFVIFNSAVFALLLVLFLLWAVPKVGTLAPKRQALAPVRETPEPSGDIVSILVESD